MRKTSLYIIASMVLAMLVVGCGNKQQQGEGADSTAVAVSVLDSALYGVVGEATSMHSLELIDENGKKTTLALDVDMKSDVQGGIMSGDHVTLVWTKNASGDMEAQKVVNITTLLGKWSSLDRNFEIKDDGSVESQQVAETKPYTAWEMVNAKLVLSRDTFDVNYLGADSLLLENEKGIFAYKRIKK